MPFGLILIELLTNSIKHSSPKDAGIITVFLKKNDANITLSIQDNGIGFNLKDEKKDALGLELVETLTEQIDGKFSIESSSKGTNCELKFFI